MKRLISVILSAALVLGCLASCTPNGTANGSSNTTSSKDKVSSGLVASGDESATSSDTSSNDPTSSKPSSSKPSTSSNSGTSSSTTADYFDVDAEVARRGLNKNQDVSVCFKEGVKGYIVNGGPYKVDGATLVRLTEVPVVGDAKVIWKDFQILDTRFGHTDPFTGYIPVEKLSDPVYMSMHLPSELQTYMKWRINASNMSPPIDEYKRAVAIGAIYKEKETVLPDDAEITLCIGKMMLLLYTEEKGWHVGKESAYPANYKTIYPLPWTLHPSFPSLEIPTDRMTVYDDHVEVKITGAMLNGNWEGISDEYASKLEGGVMHVWGEVWTGEVIDIKGMVAGYYCWIKEEEYVGKVVADTGADIKRPDKTGLQAFASRNFALTTEPRLIFGHNVGPKAYDEIMDTEKVQQLLGLK